MRVLVLLACLIIGASGLTPGTARAAAVCPTTSNTNSDCGFLITIGPTSITYAPVAGANPYDGSDDVLVGVVNNSGSTYLGSFSFSGTGNGGGLFGFDGDGICAYTGASYCSGTQTGYEGPSNTFTNISADQSSGTVDFSSLGGIADGGSSFFSLEGSPSSIVQGGGLGGLGGGGTSVPEPATFGVVLAGLAGLFSLRRRAGA